MHIIEKLAASHESSVVLGKYREIIYEVLGKTTT